MLRQSLIDCARRTLEASWAIRRARVRPPSERQPVRVGLIGLGRVARRHVWGYLQTGRATLCAGADPSRSRAVRARRRWGLGAVYADFHEMLARERLDVVSICAPPEVHHPAVLAAAGQGVRAILCEKPLCQQLDDGPSLVAACHDAGTLLAVGHQRRFAAQHRFAKAALAAGAIGAVDRIEAICARDTLRAGIHVADLLRFYVGDVASVSAQLADRKGGALPDLETMLGRGYSGDAAGEIVVRFRDAPVVAALRIGDRHRRQAKLRFGGRSGEIEVWLDGGVRITENGRWYVPPLTLNPYFEEFRAEIDALMDAVESRRPPPVTGEDGVRSLEIVIAALVSAREGHEIRLPLVACV